MYVNIFKGDHHQLPPVRELPLYNTTDQMDNPMVIKGRRAYSLFDKFTFKFKSQMRQVAESHLFTEQVSRLAVAGLTGEDWTDWRAQSFSGMEPARQEAFRDAIMLATTNDSLVEHNNNRMEAVGNPMVRIQAINTPQAAEEATSDQAHGLPNNLNICRGGRVILTRNLWTRNGLVNGATGHVAYIVYNEGNINPSLPDCIIVQFSERYRGPSCIQSEERMVAIRPETASWKVNDRTFVRKMFPLQAAFGLTIHRAQGMTLDKVLVDLGQ